MKYLIILAGILVLSGTVPERPKTTTVVICPPNEACYELIRMVAP